MTTSGGNPIADNPNPLTAVPDGPVGSARNNLLRPGRGLVESQSPAARH
jgi:hypothetical protein